MLDLAQWTAQEIQATKRVELACVPELSVVAFRSSEGDEVLRQILKYLNASGEVHVSSTTINGRFVVRLAFLSQRTTRETAGEGGGARRRSGGGLTRLSAGPVDDSLCLAG